MRSLLYIGKCSGVTDCGRNYLCQWRGVKTFRHCADACLLPVTLRGPVEIAAEVHREDGHANKDRAANDEPFGQIGIHDCVENAQEKRAARGFDACASFKPGFGDGERARRPRNQFDHDGVGE